LVPFKWAEGARGEGLKCKREPVSQADLQENTKASKP
jgi:hypothetical protein